ncbi:hypothetical protein KKF91_04435, partial [Myxococcota bacterium]|nr:hypothetical protein [Myxococcota bacterium]
MLDSNQIQGLLDQGAQLYEDGLLDEAIEKWKAALRVDPGNEIAVEYLRFVSDHFQIEVESFIQAHSQPAPAPTALLKPSPEADAKAAPDELDWSDLFNGKQTLPPPPEPALSVEALPLLSPAADAWEDEGFHLADDPMSMSTSELAAQPSGSSDAPKAKAIDQMSDESLDLMMDLGFSAWAERDTGPTADEDALVDLLAGGLPLSGASTEEEPLLELGPPLSEPPDPFEFPLSEPPINLQGFLSDEAPTPPSRLDPFSARAAPRSEPPIDLGPPISEPPIDLGPPISEPPIDLGPPISEPPFSFDPAQMASSEVELEGFDFTLNDAGGAQPVEADAILEEEAIDFAGPLADEPEDFDVDFDVDFIPSMPARPAPPPPPPRGQPPAPPAARPRGA